MLGAVPLAGFLLHGLGARPGGNRGGNYLKGGTKLAKGTIGISGFDFTKEQMSRLYQEAKELGINIREIPPGSTDPKWFAGCQALAGDYELSAIEKATDMRWFHSDWSGVDSLVKLSPFREKRAILTNSAGAYSVMIAEYILAGCIMLLRHFPAYFEAQRQCKWHEPLAGESLSGKRITVLGLGRNGSAFAQLASSLGARVSGVNTSEREKPRWLERLYHISQLNEALEKTDILVMCLPYTKETEKLIGSAELAQLPRGALLINTGRGQTLDMEALTIALANSHLAGAMVDVFTKEPLPPEDPLWKVPNLVITPHISGYTGDRLNTQGVFEIFLRNLVLWGRGQPLRNVVDIGKGY